MARAAARARRPVDEVTLVAVSKTFPADSIRAAYEVGLRHFGENRVQEFEAKRPALLDLEATWHFIGHLQRNKARRAAQVFHRIDGVDSLALAQALESEAVARERRLPALIEVHVSEEPSKTGISQENLASLAEAIGGFSNLKLRGLMGIPPYFDDPERARPFFRKLRELRDELSRRLGTPLPVLSMGMSHDFEIAIEEGATEVRIGTAIFGERPRAQV